MKRADVIWMCFPEGLDELFEIVRFERTDQAYDIWLDEKKKLSDEDFRNPNIVARGYTDYVTIQDYPMRGRPVYLHMRKNKWWNKSTNDMHRLFGLGPLYSDITSRPPEKSADPQKICTQL